MPPGPLGLGPLRFLSPRFLGSLGSGGSLLAGGPSGALRDPRGSTGVPEPTGTWRRGWIKIRDSHRHHRVSRVVFERRNPTNARRSNDSWRTLGGSPGVAQARVPWWPREMARATQWTRASCALGALQEPGRPGEPPGPSGTPRAPRGSRILPGPVAKG